MNANHIPAVDYSILEGPLEALIRYCNNDDMLCNASEVIAAEAALETVYRARLAMISAAPGTADLVAHETPNASDNGACVQPASGGVAEAGQVEAEPVELPDVEDLAHEITQDCLSFGLSTDTVARYLRSYEKKVRAALAATPTSPQAPASQAADDAFAALRALTEAMLTRADNDYMLRQLDAAVKVMAKRGCEPPVPWPDADFFVSRCEASTAPSASPHQGAAGYRHWWRMSVGTQVAVVSGLADPGTKDPYGGTSGVFERTESLGVLHQGADELREDAERYRWLRDKSVPPHNFYISVPAEFDGVRYTPDEVDAGIDAARAALTQHQAPQQGETK